ncbi:MAG: hypothetical protein IPH86_13725 [bacterium]|nr:hypothetical protein [bacterium]
MPAAVALDVPVSGAAGSARRDPGAARTATLTVVGDIAVDTVWDAATVMVGSDVVIRDGAVLTVAAGAGIRFTGHHGLVVRDGALQAWGTPTAPITWDTAHPQAFTTEPDTAGSWGGITFLNVPADNPPSFLRGCVLQHAKAVPGHGPDDDTPRVGGRCPDGAGGALRLVGPGSVEISGSILRHNAGARGGALVAHYGATPLLVNVLMHDNTAWTRAGAAYVSHAAPRFVHDTLIDNQAVNADIYARTAGAVDHFHARPHYAGCIVYGNVTNHHEPHQILEPRSPDIDHCNVEGYGLGAGGMDSDPLFLARWNTRGLPSGASPCIDAGDFVAAQAWLPEVDLAGNPRRAGLEVDLGCYEYLAPTGVPGLPLQRAIPVSAQPNPANPGTWLHWRQAGDGPVQVRVRDLGGRLVRRLVDASRAAGAQAVFWDGRDDAGRRVAAGAYVAQVEGAAGRGTVKVMLVP